MFDYGSAVANIEAYGFLWPLDLGEYYFLIDILVDLVAGRNDKVIRPSMVRKHYKLMKDAGSSMKQQRCQTIEDQQKRGLRYVYSSSIGSCLMKVEELLNLRL
ncbi:hypothetical protein T459_14391 [Capsicum annuum]|uniref:Uncharacterized protein n=1 Tax=Capsicum annuum TaxID=4072 RepID=A0A2G2ZHB5_CAPAN|nr:hypothetical protein T459_14391 [Capsicum annuum]